MRRRPSSTLFPYTTLFRSHHETEALSQTEPDEYQDDHLTTQTLRPGGAPHRITDRKSTRLNSSHRTSSYAVFCLKKKKMLAPEPDITLPPTSWRAPSRTAS